MSTPSSFTPVQNLTTSITTVTDNSTALQTTNASVSTHDTCPEKTYYIGVGVAATVAGAAVLAAAYYLVKAIKKALTSGVYRPNRIYPDYPDIEIHDSVSAIKYRPKPHVH